MKINYKRININLFLKRIKIIIILVKNIYIPNTIAIILIYANKVTYIL